MLSADRAANAAHGLLQESVTQQDLIFRRAPSSCISQTMAPTTWATMCRTTSSTLRRGKVGRAGTGRT
jgi:hypothetical protein